MKSGFAVVALLLDARAWPAKSAAVRADAIETDGGRLRLLRQGRAQRSLSGAPTSQPAERLTVIIEDGIR